MQDMQETWVQTLSQEDPLEEEMAIHSSILAWKTPWTEELGRLQSMGFQRVRHNLATEHMHTHTHTLVYNMIFDICVCFKMLIIVSLINIHPLTQ